MTQPEHRDGGDGGIGSGDYCGWLSLRELDAGLGLDKGSAFRAFKRLLPRLKEGRDFVVLDHRRHAALAAQLHAAGRLYRSSVNPVLLAPAAADLVRQSLSATG
ncbi:MAG: hypothetical protein OSA97_13655 [Nevskia sp.]|nr:hypothetical protein [Nevskia sp.]